jgi:hypothetical protein
MQMDGGVPKVAAVIGCWLLCPWNFSIGFHRIEPVCSEAQRKVLLRGL